MTTKKTHPSLRFESDPYSGYIEVTVFESHHEQIESDPEKFKFMTNELLPLLFQSSFIPKESISFKYVSTPPFTLPTDVFNNSYGYILENLRVKSGTVHRTPPFWGLLQHDGIFRAIFQYFHFQAYIWHFRVNHKIDN